MLNTEEAICRNSQEVQLLKEYRAMTRWEKNKYQRLLFRLLNHDKKAMRLSDMCAAGQITRYQLLEAM